MVLRGFIYASSFFLMIHLVYKPLLLRTEPRLSMWNTLLKVVCGSLECPLVLTSRCGGLIRGHLLGEFAGLVVFVGAWLDCLLFAFVFVFHCSWQPVLHLRCPDIELHP